MGQRIGLGIISTGRMARALAESLPHAQGIEAVAVASRQQETADRFARQFGFSKAYGDIEGLLRDEAVNLAYVASPHAMHCQHTLLCLEAGKGVLCEKPFAINAGEAMRMIDAARQRKLFLMEAMWTRYVPAVGCLREWLEEGVIGHANLMLAGGAFIPDPDPHGYLFRPDLGGGVLLDAGVYLVSMASMLFGPPIQIQAVGNISEAGVDEHDAVLLHHADGAIANLHVSLRARQPPEILLLGEQGSIRVHPPLFAPRQLTLSTATEGDRINEFPFEGNGYQFEVTAAAQCIRAGLTESPVMPLDESLRIMQTMDEIRRQIGLSYPLED